MWRTLLPPPTRVRIHTGIDPRKCAFQTVPTMVDDVLCTQLMGRDAYMQYAHLLQNDDASNCRALQWRDLGAYAAAMAGAWSGRADVVHALVERALMLSVPGVCSVDADGVVTALLDESGKVSKLAELDRYTNELRRLTMPLPWALA